MTAITLTFPPIAKGETVIRAQDHAGLDVTVGYCCRIGLEWSAVLYAMADHPGTNVASIDRPTLAALRTAVCGRLERSGKWWA
jgi:hypothetical protein